MKVFGTLVAVAALAMAIVALLGTIRVRETVAQAECRHRCERERDTDFIAIALAASQANIEHHQKLLECRLDNLGNPTARQQCEAQENNRHAQVVGQFTARSNQVTAAFITCSNNCYNGGSRPSDNVEIGVDLDCIEDGGFICFKEVPELCKRVSGPCDDCWTTLCPGQSWEFSADTPLTVSLVAGPDAGSARVLAAPGAPGKRIALAVPRGIKLEKEEKLWVRFGFSQKPSSKKVTLHWRKN